MSTSPNESIGDIVAADYRAAAVFERFGMDFCCGGRQTITEACQLKAVDVGELLRAIDHLPAWSPAAGQEDAAWTLDALIDHIVSTHHAYVRRAIPVLSAHTAKIAAVHGSRSPELPELARHFSRVAADLTLHMAKEEEVLFPYIRTLFDADRAGRRLGASPFGSVRYPIRMMEAEHQDAGDEMRLLREMTDGYALPDFACTTYRVCFDELQEFERDLHRHVHLENNILFPGAVKLEELRS